MLDLSSVLAEVKRSPADIREARAAHARCCPSLVFVRKTREERLSAHRVHGDTCSITTVKKSAPRSFLRKVLIPSESSCGYGRMVT